MLIRSAGWTRHHHYHPLPHPISRSEAEKTADWAAHFKARPALTLCTQRSHFLSICFFFLLFINMIWYMHIFYLFWSHKVWQNRWVGGEGKQIKIAHIKRNFLFAECEREPRRLLLAPEGSFGIFLFTNLFSYCDTVWKQHIFFWAKWNRQMQLEAQAANKTRLYWQTEIIEMSESQRAVAKADTIVAVNAIVTVNVTAFIVV